MIKISYNQEVDALYIRLSVKLTGLSHGAFNLTLNMGDNEQLVGKYSELRG